MFNKVRNFSKKTSVGLLALMSATSLFVAPMNTNAKASVRHHRVTRHLSHNEQLRIQYFRTHKNRFFNIYGRIPVAKNKKLNKKQNKQQIKLGAITIHRIKHQVSKPHRAKTNWFTDNLSRRNLRARQWIVGHESGYEWYVENWSGSGCIGYFQLSPRLLGYHHGHLNLSKQHQVKTADAYARARYGSWINAKKFWQAHHWY